MMMMMRTFALMVVVLTAVLGTVARTAAAAETRLEALVIGNNRPPFKAGATETTATDRDLPTLRYADDDAAAFYEFIMHSADAGRLLTVMDRDTQALYPDLVNVASAPTVAGIRAAVAEIRKRLERYARDGKRSTLLIFFSGHGSLDDSGTPELALADGGITQKFLYEEILDQLPAGSVHLLVDACHAEAVVRPRDVEARRVPISASEANAFVLNSTLARYPNVGAIVAAASERQAHEWDQLRQGVFTYALLSALRGGADVNRDQRLEYSEVSAFLAAAGRGIDNPRARLSVVARPPDADRRAALVDLSKFRRAKLRTLSAIPPGASTWQIDDDSGRHLATVHSEPNFVVDLVLPADRTLYVRSGTREARLPSAPGSAVRFQDLRFEEGAGRARGAIDEAVRRGLFASAFGRGYYSGFVDQADEFVPVTLPSDEGVSSELSRRGETRDFTYLLGGGISNNVAKRLGASAGVRLGMRPQRRSGFMASLDTLYANDGAVAEWRAGASAGWVWPIAIGPATPYVGVTLGAGFMLQDWANGTSRVSPFGSTAPVLGSTFRITSVVNVWSEAQVSMLVYRRDSSTVATVAPELWVGGALAL